LHATLPHTARFIAAVGKLWGTRFQGLRMHQIG
jgi:hypothetical protein